jgi:hypothetical protein
LRIEKLKVRNQAFWVSNVDIRDTKYEILDIAEPASLHALGREPETTI